MTFAAVALFVIAIALAAAVVLLERGRHGIVDALTAAHARALNHADVRRREAEQRAGQAEAELRALQAETAESGYRHLLDRQVVVQRDDGQAIRGILSHTYADTFALEHPRLVGPGGAQDLGGELLVPRDRVATVQAFDEVDEPA